MRIVAIIILLIFISSAVDHLSDPSNENVAISILVITLSSWCIYKIIKQLIKQIKNKENGTNS